jgi:hypothetical protein
MAARCFTNLRGLKVSLGLVGQSQRVFGSVSAENQAGIAVVTEPDSPAASGLAPGRRVSCAVALTDKQGSFEATVCLVAGNTIVLGGLSEIRLEGGCSIYRRGCDLEASYRPVGTPAQRSPDRLGKLRRPEEGFRRKVRCRDISVTGLLLELSEEVRSGDRLDVELLLPGTEMPTRVIAEVVRRSERPAEGGSSYLAGLRIVQASRAAAARIRGFVTEQEDALGCLAA